LSHDKNTGSIAVLRRLLLLPLLLVLGAVVYAGYLLALNNLAVSPPAESRMERALDRGVDWLVAHEERIVSTFHPVLWWMVGRSAELTQHPELQRLLRKYLEQTLTQFSNSPWRYLFESNIWVPVTEHTLEALPDYNVLFLYGLSCDTELGERPLVRRQLESEFCPEVHPFSPACTTHQLMGVRFMQARGCGDSGQNEAVIRVLQDRIVRQLTWDPRVVDVYIQRVLMLQESGAGERVKPVWLQRILNAQLQDGGWGDFETVLPIPGERAVGFSGRLLSIGTEKASFHATAQAIFLLSLLLEEH
jgi:hypothetical protein